MIPLPPVLQKRVEGLAAVGRVITLESTESGLQWPRHPDTNAALESLPYKNHEEQQHVHSHLSRTNELNRIATANRALSVTVGKHAGQIEQSIYPLPAHKLCAQLDAHCRPLLW